MSAKLGTAIAPSAEADRPTGLVDARSLQGRLARRSRPTLGDLADPTLLTSPLMK